MQIQEQLQIRKQKGLQIVQSGKVIMQGHKWIVPSRTTNKRYEVVLYLNRQECNCPDFLERGIKCKHIFAVKITITKETNGSETKITKKLAYALSTFVA
ncbi:MAG: SWIM zinc finger domain-containing protein [Candidatus Marsarchaeota archaeon]|jgi:predicted nucleic acid-binding Zn finger protein|nr:SWIM zinc finger domain-containing protein [Candidatus Marsarchaeota archaeon]MCL5111922.1 SWIM zinc finger domain-containing protein [Candidatus Marsarchaeota archaeon]